MSRTRPNTDIESMFPDRSVLPKQTNLYQT